MNKFDELLVLNSKLDAVLDDMKKANNHLENELKAKRDALQKQMFDDVSVLRGYMLKVGMKNTQLVLSTGIVCRNTEDYVFTFDVTTNSRDIGLGVINANTRKDRAFYRWFDYGVPIEEVKTSWGRPNYKEDMFTIMKNWDVAYANMQNDLFDKLKEFMKTKANDVAKKQSYLVKELDKFDERGN